MKIHTDVTTLSRLYPLFKDAGIEGVLTGDFSLIQDLTLPDLAARFLASGAMPQICAIITKAHAYISDAPAQPPKSWELCSCEECLGIILPFVIDITIGPLNLKNPPDPIPPLETSS
jgi:hypothetical protein